MLGVDVLSESANVPGKSQSLSGDAVDMPVDGERIPDISRGVVQLRFSLRNTDVHSFRFD